MSSGRVVAVGPVRFGNALPLSVIAGPCQLQTADHACMIAESLAETCARLGLGLVFKASFDKANRTAHDSPRGPGLDAGLRMLETVRRVVGVPVLTDVHLPEHCAAAAAVADALQIPAFLCRQTDLLAAAAATGAAVNVKKGQFLAPADMGAVAAKLQAAGCGRILLTERGTSFGYNSLVTDFTGLPVMAATGWPVIMDATHAVQSPGGLGHASGGRAAMAPLLARAAVAAGVAGIFLETHEDPASAPSDGPCMIPLDRMAQLLAQLAALDRLAKPATTPEV